MFSLRTFSMNVCVCVDLTGAQDGSVRMFEWGHSQQITCFRSPGNSRVTKIRFNYQGNKVRPDRQESLVCVCVCDCSVCKPAHVCVCCSLGSWMRTERSVSGRPAPQETLINPIWYVHRSLRSSCAVLVHLETWNKRNKSLLLIRAAFIWSEIQ